MQPEPANPVSVPAASPPAPAGQCENCGAPLYGKYCFACGQPTSSMVRQFRSVVGEVADSVLNIDERLFKTLLPLYLRPGRLTLDYFAGKRARYVAPFRLVFFLAIVAFFALQIGFRLADQHAPPAIVHGAGTHAQLVPAPAKDVDTHFGNGDIRINDKVVWNATTMPSHIRWLPASVNAWLNGLIANAQANLHRMNSGNPGAMWLESNQLIARALAVAPTVLFVLLPFFALLLKIFYVFKRRLYMEHLVVAMHSHAFLMLSILVILVLGLLRSVLQGYARWLGIPFMVLNDAAAVWILVYLFLMQKRVYRQGWLMTAVKFGCIGWCYAFLVGFGMAAAALISLASA